MKDMECQEEEITSLIRARYDAYIKAACRNTLRNYRCQQNRTAKYGISFTPLFEDASDYPYEEKGFSETEAEQITVFGYHIFLTDKNLANVLNSLPENNRITLLLHVAANIPLKDIAGILDVSLSMVKKYKKSALEMIRRDMFREDDTQNI